MKQMDKRKKMKAKKGKGGKKKGEDTAIDTKKYLAK